MTYTVSSNCPLQLNPQDRVSEILQNVSIVLRTRRGSCPMYREFGLPMNYIGKPIPIAQSLMVAEITDAITEFEPRCRVVSVTCTEEDNGTITPIVEVEILD